MIKNKLSIIRKKNKGLTLLEVIISIAILTIIITPIFSLVMSSVKINRNSTDKVKATNEAQQLMENTKASPTIITGKTIEVLPSGLLAEIFISEVYKDDNAEKKELKYPFNIKSNSEVEVKVNEKDMLIIIDDSNVHIYKGNVGDYNKVKDNKDENRYKFFSINKDFTLFLENNKEEIGFKYVDKAYKNSVSYDYIDKLSASDEKGNVQVIFEGTEKNMANIKNVNISGVNKVKENFDLYFMKVKNSTNKYTFNNEYGKINCFNVSLPDKEYTNRSRVYKIGITIFKDSNKNKTMDSDEIINEMQGYKTVLE